MLVLFLAADKGFVGFDFARQLLDTAVLHGKPDAVKHEPRGFLRHAKRAVNLAAADAVLVVRDHPNGGKPLVKPDRAVFKDRADLDRKLLAALFVLALPHAPGRHEGNGFALAMRADNTVRPPNFRQQHKAVVGVLVENDSLLQRLGKLLQTPRFGVNSGVHASLSHGNLAVSSI